MDMGVHDFSFAIMPHVNRMQESGVYVQALRFINPVRSKEHTYKSVGCSANGLLVCPSRSPIRPFSDMRWQTQNAPSVCIETIKRGEQDSTTGAKTVIIRILETLGARVVHGAIEL
jgi:alpha-mannosidase